MFKKPGNTVSPYQMTPENLDLKTPAGIGKGIGFMGNLRVGRAERAAKEEVQTQIAVDTAKAAGDIAMLGLQQQVTMMKGALATRAVSGMAALATEQTASFAQGIQQVRAVHVEAVRSQFEQRAESLRMVDAVAGKGMLMAGEADNARAYIADLYERDTERISANVERSMDAMSAHMNRTTDHILNINRKH
ncbi:hypothetical protein [Azospirillum humicireducens]|nr:hypothetical protein [Azospirillum humicireducens]